MFRLGANEVVDATIRGCRARYINHSCDPNCFAVITLPEGGPTQQQPQPEQHDAAHTSLGGDTLEQLLDGAPATAQLASASAGDGSSILATQVTRAPTTAASGRRVFVYALRSIGIGEELTYDYQFPADERRIACRCGSAACRGTINKDW